MSAVEIEKVAAHWRLRQDEPGWTAQDEAALEAWLAESTLHEVAYVRLDHGWRSIERLNALKGAKPTAQSRRSWRFAPQLLAAGFALTVLGGGLFAGVQTGAIGRSVYATPIGGRQVVPLSDGSRVELNTDSRLRASVRSTHREVWLDRGEAYFEIAHDPSHPFVVHAGDQRVTVLGTRFSVLRQPDGRVRVAVVEGRVRVEPAESRGVSRPAIMTRGDTVIASGVSLLATPKSEARVDAQLGWRDGLLIFDQVSLAEAAGEFNRYNKKRLVITDSAAAAIPIGGRFEAANVETFVRLIREGFRLKVEERGDEIRISS
jgi:transmembrane sensor